MSAPSSVLDLTPTVTPKSEPFSAEKIDVKFRGLIWKSSVRRMRAAGGLFGDGEGVVAVFLLTGFVSFLRATSGRSETGPALWAVAATGSIWVGVAIGLLRDEAMLGVSELLRRQDFVAAAFCSVLAEAGDPKKKVSTLLDRTTAESAKNARGERTSLVSFDMVSSSSASLLL
jgi:hypothetical protein